MCVKILMKITVACAAVVNKQFLRLKEIREN